MERDWETAKGEGKKRGKSRKREGRGNEFFFFPPLLFFPGFFGGKPSFWELDNTLSLAYGTKIRAQKASERVKQKKIVKETQDFFLCPPTVVISFLSPCVLRQIRKREAKTNCHRKRMIIIRRIELIFPTLQINWFVSGVLHLDAAVFVQRVRQTTHLLQGTHDSSKKSFTGRGNLSADTVYDYPPNPLRRTVLCTRLASLGSEVSLDRSFANPT